MINYIEDQLPFPNKKRVEYIANTISEYASNYNGETFNLLDIGCGTGELFTIPLSVRLQHIKKINILGIDIDRTSIERAKINKSNLSLNNTQFDFISINKIEEKFNCICLMAVLEHLKDPEKILDTIQKLLSPRGLFILYIPNGFGSHEIETLIYNKIKEKKIIYPLKWFYDLIRKIKNKRKKSDSFTNFVIKESLNEENLHIQRFKFREIKKMLASRGFRIRNIYKTHALNGPISNRIINRNEFMKRMDNKIVQILPPVLASDWTFVCILE